MAGSDAANGPVEGTLPLWERCNEALLTAGTAGREAVASLPPPRGPTNACTPTIGPLC